MVWKSLLFTHPFTKLLLQRNEARRVRGSNTRATVLDRFVCDGELPKVVPNHFRLKEKNKNISPQIPEFSPTHTTDCLILADLIPDSQPFPVVTGAKFSSWHPGKITSFSFTPNTEE